ncbi:hypothetical protein NPIL_128071 [Nephila pilipes]|uniref:Uncharacterized protein n=1 Tax=Nephila pilipes TaxID=299642 RepID=A0A8X6TN19_NEPPI|nr:hypothetical protein NPIL_128071 [Nephila pilipes]
MSVELSSTRSKIGRNCITKAEWIHPSPDLSKGLPQWTGKTIRVINSFSFCKSSNTRPIIRLDNQTTKIHPLFDTSPSGKDKPLKECLLKGTNLE